ncbi:MAG: hypothetical protein M1814_004365 [Vezdaea aestivalis]|nr:MAG: hypothetical protein M1814_004365 [Vezdaea aestivalis]
MSATKKPTQAATDDQLDKLFEGIEDEPTTSKPRPAASTKKAHDKKSSQSEQDLLAELDSLAQQRPASRPQTPKVNTPGASGTATPKEALQGRAGEEKAQGNSLSRKSGEVSRAFHEGSTPDGPAGKKASETQPSSGESTQATGGGWWGSVFATASAAVKTAEAAVKEIQQTEEAKRWTDQVKGINVGTLRDLGGELRSRALPTFTTILQTIAPPISSHERLQIHITHDFVGYPSLDPLIYSTFSRVMAQVEGGDLMVIQKGQEASPRRDSDVGFTGTSKSGWNDGPWWRSTGDQRSLSVVKGLVEGTKLAKASAESYATEYYSARGGVEEAAKQAAEVLSESNPVRRSDIFLAIQAISHEEQITLFGGPVQAKQEGGIVEPEEIPENLTTFAIYLHDPIHGITFHTLSQSFPQRWVNWLDAPAPSQTTSEVQKTVKAELPEEIAQIIAEGGVDPREWVSEWVEEVLLLGIGVMAQKYVARRMGVGEGGIGRGKARQEAVESGGGEAARAI